MQSEVAGHSCSSAAESSGQPWRGEDASSPASSPGSSPGRAQNAKTPYRAAPEEPPQALAEGGCPLSKCIRRASVLTIDTESTSWLHMHKRKRVGRQIAPITGQKARTSGLTRFCPAFDRNHVPSAAGPPRVTRLAGREMRDRNLPSISGAIRSQSVYPLYAPALSLLYAPCMLHAHSLLLPRRAIGFLGHVHWVRHERMGAQPLGCRNAGCCCDAVYSQHPV